MKKLLTRSNIASVIILSAMAVLLISPGIKAFLIEGLMKIGFFQPAIPPGKETALATEISFQDQNGKTISLSSLKGKVVFINFWATWCPPCIAEMPSVNQLYTQFRTNPDVVFIPVDVDHNFSKSVPFMTGNKFMLPVYAVIGNIPDGLLSEGIPTTIVVDKSGKIALRHIGPADYTNKGFTKYLTELSKQ